MASGGSPDWAGVAIIISLCGFALRGLLAHVDHASRIKTLEKDREEDRKNHTARVESLERMQALQQGEIRTLREWQVGLTAVAESQRDNPRRGRGAE